MEVLIGWKCSILSYSNDKIERRKEDSKRVSFLLRVRLDSITCYLKKSCELHKDAKQRSRTKRKAAGIDENIPSGKFHRFYFREVKRKCINAQTMRIFVFYTPRKSGCSTLVRKFPFFFFFFLFSPSPPCWCNRWKPETENRIVYLKKTRDAGQAFANVHGLDDIIAAKASLKIFLLLRAKGKRT